MNRKIVKINSELKDANQIKDNYVSLYMKLSTQYIRQVDEERSHLRKIAKTDGMDASPEQCHLPGYSRRMINIRESEVVFTIAYHYIRID